jgi:hypothetical protein
MHSSIRSIILRFSGCLLFVLGGVHLAVTPFISRMVEQGASPDAAEWLTPPMILNHVVVGVLLLPLGGLVYYAAPHAAQGVRWATVVTRSIAATIVTLPPILFFIMGTRYFTAVPFRIAAGIVCVASLSLLAVAFWPAKSGLQGVHPKSEG